MAYWHLGLQLVDMLRSLATSLGLSPSGCQRSLSFLRSSLDLCFNGCGLAAPGFKHALQVLGENLQSVSHGCQAFLNGEWCWNCGRSWLGLDLAFVTWHLVPATGKMSLDYFLGSLTIGMWLPGLTTYVSGSQLIST